MSKNCPTCGANMEGRWESLTRGLAESLIKFYKVSGSAGTLHLQAPGVFTKSQYANFYKLRHWDFVAPTQNTGVYQITKRGKLFVAGLATARTPLFVFRNEVQGKMHPKGRFVKITSLLEKDVAEWIRADEWRSLKELPGDPAQQKIAFEDEPADDETEIVRYYTRYYTFGHIHRHELENGTILDKDIILRVKAEDPRERVFQVFGARWSMEYTTPRNMKYFPRGIYDLLPNDRQKRGPAE